RNDVLDEKRFKAQFRRAFLKGIQDGVLLRTNATKDCEGLSGRVKLAPAKPKPARKPKNAATKKAPAQDLEVGDQAEEPSVSAAPKPPGRRRAPKMAKEVTGPEDEEVAQEEVAAQKAKVGRPRRKPAENNDDVDEVDAPKAGTSRRKKPTENDDEDMLDEVELPRAKVGRPRKKQAENKDDLEDHPSDKAKAKAGKQKASFIDLEPAHEPEANLEADQEEPQKEAAAKGRQQPLRSRRNVQ
ncbi:unnamed protein product, partial [Ixodes hexagonus]